MALNTTSPCTRMISSKVASLPSSAVTVRVKVDGSDAVFIADEFPDVVEHLTQIATPCCSASSCSWLRCRPSPRLVATINDGDTCSAPSFLLCTAISMAVMPAPITKTRRPTGKLGQVIRLTQFGDVIHRVFNTRQVFTRDMPMALTSAHSYADEDCIVVMSRNSSKGEVFAKRGVHI